MSIDNREHHNGLNNPQIAQTLERLHLSAKRDKLVFLKAAPSVLWGSLFGRTLFESAKPFLKDAYIPVSPEIGEFMYLLARARKAKTIVEFGSSFGVSSIYLAAAAREANGIFIGSEIETHKLDIARDNIEAAGLTQWTDIRSGDAMQSLSDIKRPIDFLFLDGWKAIYTPMLQLLIPALAPGAVIMADNITTFKKTLKPYVDFVSDPKNGFETTILPFKSGIAFSIWLKNNHKNHSQKEA